MVVNSPPYHMVVGQDGWQQVVQAVHGGVPHTIFHLDWGGGGGLTVIPASVLKDTWCSRHESSGPAVLPRSIEEA
jgi:hypothetical protein